MNNHQMDTGTYTITGFQIAIFAGYCAKVLYDPIGTYDWSYEGETLTFKRALPDSCDTRTYFLARKHKLLP
ncbi:MAG: hypothetical protein ACT4QE_03180 [Anaerolineales bacterium]